MGGELQLCAKGPLLSERVRKKQKVKERGRPLPSVEREEGTADVEKLERKIKKLNLSTYKFHALGDYVQAIRQFGTTDNYTTQIVRRSHNNIIAHC